MKSISVPYLCRAKSDKSAPDDYSRFIAKTAREINRESVDNAAIVFGETVVSLLCLMSYGLNEPRIKFIVAGNQRPKILTTILKIAAFVEFVIASVSATIYGNDLGRRVALPNHLGCSAEVGRHIRYLRTVSPAGRSPLVGVGR